MARNLSVVYKWYSGAHGPGTLTASGCGTTSGDAVVSVLSSGRAGGGPFTCLG